MYKEAAEITAGVLGASLIFGGLVYETTMYLMLSRYEQERGKLEILKSIILHPKKSRQEIEELESRLK